MVPHLLPRLPIPWRPFIRLWSPERHHPPRHARAMGQLSGTSLLPRSLPLITASCLLSMTLTAFQKFKIMGVILNNNQY